MSLSAAQMSANQANAQKSTGPLSIEGKQKVAGNALKHGLFSKNLLLTDEDPHAYHQLLGQLSLELSPIGRLEHTLIERIAVSLWRQQRLIRAETATVELEYKPIHIVTGINQELNLSFSDNAVTEDDLTEVDQDHYHWCQAVVAEFYSMDTPDSTTIAWLIKLAPLMYQQLLTDAEEEGQSPEQYLQAFNNPNDFFISLVRYCQDQIKKADKKPLIFEIAELVKSKRSILKEKLRDSLAKYQIMLDNELYKALKALRDTQDWRYKTLTIVPVDNGFDLINQTSPKKSVVK
jgi:hypothetical protein